MHSQIYVDKTELISYTNSVLATNQKKYLCQPPKGDLENPLQPICWLLIIVRDVSLILYLKTEKSAVQKIIKIFKHLHNYIFKYPGIF